MVMLNVFIQAMIMKQRSVFSFSIPMKGTLPARAPGQQGPPQGLGRSGRESGDSRNSTPVTAFVADVLIGSDTAMHIPAKEVIMRCITRKGSDRK